MTDDEILAAPPRLLSIEQRRRRRQLKKNAAADRTRSRRKAAQNGESQPHRRRGPIQKSGKPTFDGPEEYVPPPPTKIKFCQSETKKGLNCESYAVMGSKFCINHMDDEEKDRLGIIKNTTKGLRTNASAPALMKDMVEVATAKALKPYFDAIGVELVGFNEEGQPVVRDLGEDAGLMLHGESKDGDIVMTHYPDVGGRVQIMEKLFDRVYGKPKQTQVLEGGVTPIQIQPVRTAERSRAVLDIARRSGMISVEPAPEPTLEAAPPTVPGASEPLTGEVVEMRPSSDD